MSLRLAAAALCVAACASLQSRDEAHPPIVFVHGHLDSAALWMTTIWRFESNGWPRDRLLAMDTIYPAARSEDDVAEPFHSSTAEHVAQLAAFIEKVRRATGEEKIVLVGNSRGGLAIRDYVKNGGRANVSRAILGGTPNHGVWTGSFHPASEFNGASPFLRALNAPQGPNGEEVTPGVAFMTLRSDNQDKFTQPDGRWIGQPALKTNATFDGPALRGAENVVLPGADHHQTSFGRDAFAHMYRFVTGHPPATVDVVPEKTIVLDGAVTGLAGTVPTNLPIAGASVEVFRVSPETGERTGPAVHSKKTGDDGRWGPFAGTPGAFYEIVVSADGYAITHFYRSPFPRSSDVVHLRPGRLADADKKAASVVTLYRPRGYLALRREHLRFDGKDPPGIEAGVPGSVTSTLRLDDAQPRTVVAEVGRDRIAVRTWPVAGNHLVRAEFND